MDMLLEDTIKQIRYPKIQKAIRTNDVAVNVGGVSEAFVEWEEDPKYNKTNM